MSKIRSATKRKINKNKIFIHEELKTCRLCLIDRAVYSIFDEDLTALNEVLSYCNLKPFKNDGLPEHVCKVCLKESQRIVKFIKHCEENDRLYRENLKLATIDIDGVKTECKELKEEPRDNEDDSEDYGFTLDDNVYSEEAYFNSYSEDNKADVERLKLEKKEIGDITNVLPDLCAKDHLEEISLAKKSQSKEVKPKVKKKYVRKNSDKTSKLCQICGKVLKHSSSYRHHIKLHSGEKFDCLECEKSFPTKAQMTQHHKLHFPSPTVPCQICGKSYSAKTLKMHMRVFHERKQQITCEICKRVLNTATSYSVHMKVHRGEKKYECDMCGRKFTLKSVLAIHVRTHTGDKPFVCDYCPHRFSARKSLKRHTRLHTGERPYVCPVCTKGFMQSSNLKSHVRNNHKHFNLKDLKKLNE